MGEEPGRFKPHGETMALKIGVMGDASADRPDEWCQRARQFGEEIALAGCITVTGACPGLPLEAARGAQTAGGQVVGISPALSLDEHVHHYHSPANHHDVLIFTGSGLMGREVVNIRSSDMVVIVGGRSGTLGELAIAYDDGKLIRVLTGTGGITAIVPEILCGCEKDTGARVVYDDDAKRLVTELLRVYTTSHYGRFCEDSCGCHGGYVGEDDGGHRVAGKVSEVVP